MKSYRYLRTHNVQGNNIELLGLPWNCFKAEYLQKTSLSRQKFNNCLKPIFGKSKVMNEMKIQKAINFKLVPYWIIASETPELSRVCVQCHCRFCERYRHPNCKKQTSSFFLVSSFILKTPFLREGASILGIALCHGIIRNKTPVLRVGASILGTRIYFE